MQGDSLADFDRRSVCLEEATQVVYVAGSGPAVVVMAEMAGISPHVTRFARWVRAVLRCACVSTEFGALVANESSPVTPSLGQQLRGGPHVS